MTVTLAIGIPKPKRRDRPGEKRKREIKRKDRIVSQSVKGKKCATCDRPATDPAHIVPRRFQKLRHEPLNILPKCRRCHQAEKPDKVKQRIRILHSDPTL